MTLTEALHVLTEIHTRDDDVTGFVVMVGAGPQDFEQDRYLEAWRVVRQHIHKQTEPTRI